MSLRSELLAAAVAQRDRVLAELAKDPDLSHVARYEWGLLVDKLTSGGPMSGPLRSIMPSWRGVSRRGGAFAGADVPTSPPTTRIFQESVERFD